MGFIVDNSDLKNPRQPGRSTFWSPDHIKSFLLCNRKLSVSPQEFGQIHIWAAYLVFVTNLIHLVTVRIASALVLSTREEILSSDEKFPWVNVSLLMYTSNMSLVKVVYLVTSADHWTSGWGGGELAAMTSNHRLTAPHKALKGQVC